MRTEAVVRNGVRRMRGLISLGVSGSETGVKHPHSLSEILTSEDLVSKVRETGAGGVFRITRTRKGLEVKPENPLDNRGREKAIAAVVIVRDPNSTSPLGVTEEESLFYERLVNSPTRHKSAILVIARQNGEEDVDELLLKRREEIAGESARESERKRVVSNVQALENQLAVVVALLEAYNVEFIQGVIKAGSRSKEAIVRFL